MCEAEKARARDEMKSAAMKDAQKVCDLTAENEKLRNALEAIRNGARSQGPFTGISWRCVETICDKALGQIEERGTRDEVDAAD